MPQLIRPAYKVKIAPKDGEIEITLNINITVDGKVTTTAENAAVIEEEENKMQFIPDLSSGMKLPSFGK